MTLLRPMRTRHTSLSLQDQFGHKIAVRLWMQIVSRTLAEVAA